MDNYFKLLRAEEEIQRLNVEVPRFATFIRDENQYLLAMEEQVRPSKPALAFQIGMKRMEMGRYDALHMKIFDQITQLKGFTGGRLYDVFPPAPPAEAPVTQQEPPLPKDRMAVDEEVDREEDLEEEQAGEEQDDAVLGAYYSVLEFSYDNASSYCALDGP